MFRKLLIGGAVMHQQWMIEGGCQGVMEEVYFEHQGKTTRAKHKHIEWGRYGKRGLRLFQGPTTPQPTRGLLIRVYNARLIRPAL